MAMNENLKLRVKLRVPSVDQQRYTYPEEFWRSSEGSLKNRLIAAGEPFD